MENELHLYLDDVPPAAWGWMWL